VEGAGRRLLVHVVETNQGEPGLGEQTGERGLVYVEVRMRLVARVSRDNERIRADLVARTASASPWYSTFHART